MDLKKKEICPGAVCVTVESMFGRSEFMKMKV